LSKAEEAEEDMPFKITYEPLNKIVGVKPKTVEKSSASEAWILVQGLQASDERVTIMGPNGRSIRWQDLKELASKEAN
jgi:hypothetical protein